MTELYGAWGASGRALAWPLLRWAVRETFGWERLPEVFRSPRGKPFFAPETGVWFSLSHSGGAALCALSDEGSVGVDVELVRPRRPGLLAYVSGGERVEGEDWAEFCRLWTLKESWCKQQDIPIYPPRLVPDIPPCPHKSYRGDGWRAALCAPESLPEAVKWCALLADGMF